MHLAPSMPVTPVRFLAALLLAVTACASEPEKEEDKKPEAPPAPMPIVSADMPGLPSAHLVGDVILAGQPTPEGLVNARDSGVSVVINTRTQSEMSFDERSVAQGLGMRYVSLAFTPETLDDIVVDSFIFEIKNRRPEEGRILVHCNSGSRVAALWAPAG